MVEVVCHGGFAGVWEEPELGARQECARAGEQEHPGQAQGRRVLVSRRAHSPLCSWGSTSPTPFSKQLSCRIR